MKIDIISTELIKPSSPTPSHLQKFKLSFLDQIIPAHFIPLLFYYICDETSNLTQSAMSFRLKKSLSDALTHFYPLAGKMEGQSFVDCSDQGVKYMEAHVDSQLSDVIMCPQVAILDQLIPYDLSCVHTAEAEEQLAIQVNLFNCGGIVIGTCISHRIADVCTFCNFIKCWSAVARGEINSVFPIFDSAVMFPPQEHSSKNTNFLAAEKLVTKRFIFSASAITAVKTHIVDIMQPTRVEIVSALIWKCAIKKAKPSAVFHPVNLRPRMVPPLSTHSFGNIFQMASAVADDQENELSVLVSKLRAAFAKIDSDHTMKLVGETGFEFAMNNFKKIGALISEEERKVLRCTSWCKFPIYDADFGWGKPCWVSTASFPTKDTIILIDSIQTGGIEAWVVMNEQDMAQFEQNYNLILS